MAPAKIKKCKPYTPVPKGARNPCWIFFVIDPEDENWALCKVEDCTIKRIGRGGLQGARFSTQNLTQHMERYHPVVFAPHLEKYKEREALRKSSEVSIKTHLKYSRKKSLHKTRNISYAFYISI